MWYNLHIIIGSRNQLFDVNFTFDVDRLRIACIFLNTTITNAERSCTVMFGLGQDLSSCRNLTQSLRSEQRAGNISIDLPIGILAKTNMSNDACFVVRASDDRYTAEVQRTLTVISGILV